MRFQTDNPATRMAGPKAQVAWPNIGLCLTQRFPTSSLV